MTNEKQVCCGPTVRLSGNEYRCGTKGCEKDVTDAHRSEGLAGLVIHWRGLNKYVIDESGRRWTSEDILKAARV